jgi:uncharacterized protein with HEPN domain
MASKDEVYLRHILDAILAIEQFIGVKEKNEFLQDKLLQAGAVRELEVIGEAAKKLSPAAQERAPEIPWKSIAGMRDKLIHDYFSVDLEAVWKTLQEDLPLLKQAVMKLLESQ